jgi:hypothetical protein
MAVLRKPSITYWNRVEPSPRSDSLVRGLEAAVRDPAWFLARQWQMGEFRGEDAGSAATVSFRARTTRFESWRARNDEAQPFDMRAPLEALVEDEDVSPNWALAVELGQVLARMLVRAGASATTIDLFRNAYPTPRPNDLTVAARRDHELVRFLRVCGGRSIDGVAALTAAAAAAPSVPAAVGVPAGAEETAAQAALASFIEWERAVYGRVGTADAPAWRPERLDYDLEITARTATGDRTRMHAYAGPNGEFDWYAFDEIGRDAQRSDSALAVEESAFSLFPTTVSFSGMPHSRWWQFEDARFNWTSVDADRRELAKAMILDFMLVQSNDWFLVPFGHKVGSLVTIDQLLVRDVFGEYTLGARADADAAGDRARWTMYTTVVGAAGGEAAAEYFILPPSTLRTTTDGPNLEEVRFMRDEQANLVWAVEARAENGVGRAWPGHERALAFPDDAPAPPDTDAPLRYRLQTSAPMHWIPFPPVQIDATRRAVALERAAMQRFIDGALHRIEPVGRVLRPTNLDNPAIYRIREEEVTRSGERVLRANKRSRWIDGSTHAWISRRRRAGLGEGSSGLRYDLAEQASADARTPET